MSKNTAQQQADNLAYHNRDVTLRGMALSNWMREYFDESINPPAGEYPYGICFGGDTIQNFVAVGESASVAIQKSPAGSFWQAMALGKKLGVFAGALRDVCYGNGSYCAVGDLEEIQSAPEALPATWDQRRTAGAKNLLGVCYGTPDGSPLFVAVGETGTILTSPDLITWTAQTAAGAYADNFQAVCWTGTRFIAVGNAGEIQVSTNGVNWVQVATGEALEALNDIVVGEDEDGNMVIMLVGLTVGENLAIVRTTPDGLTWTVQTPQTSLLPTGFNAVGFAPGVFIAGGLGGEIQISYDNGETWVFQEGCHITSYALAFGRGTHCMCVADNKSFSGLPYGLILRTLRAA